MSISAHTRTVFHRNRIAICALRQEAVDARASILHVYNCCCCYTRTQHWCWMCFSFLLFLCVLQNAVSSTVLLSSEKRLLFVLCSVFCVWRWWCCCLSVSVRLYTIWMPRNCTVAPRVAIATDGIAYNYVLSISSPWDENARECMIASPERDVYRFNYSQNMRRGLIAINFKYIFFSICTSAIKQNRVRRNIYHSRTPFYY